MTFGQAISRCFRKYVTFSGRASRPEYWYFVLFMFLGGLAAGVADAVVFGETDGPLAALFGLATFLPGLAAGWRRMHDSGRSGLYLFYPLIVIIGISSFFGITFGVDVVSDDMLDSMDGFMAFLFGISAIVLVLSPLIVLWWLARPSEPGPNRYGPNPNEVPS